MEVEVLHRQGKSIRAIARATGLARNSVRAVLRGQHDGRYGPRVPRSTKLDAFKATLRDRIAAASPIRLPATVLLREIRAEGYTGGITQLKAFVRSIQPVVLPAPIVRFETAPGEQLQIDFVVFRRGLLPLRAFTAELGYSRYAYVEFTDNERSETLIACLERALQFFGGVPAHVLSDNPKTIVTERDAYGEGLHRYNAALLDCAKHYGVQLKLCAPYRAQTKGKVERFHRYLRESFFNPLQAGRAELVDVALANREVRGWLGEVANCRLHATLKERPDVRFALERASLRALAVPYAGRPSTQRGQAVATGPIPVESFQHPLAVYDRLAKEIAA